MAQCGSCLDCWTGNGTIDDYNFWYKIYEEISYNFKRNAESEGIFCDYYIEEEN